MAKAAGLPGGRYELILRGGFVVDGTGAPGFRADLAIADDRIAAVGDLREESGEKEVNAAGKVIAPGFIDAYTHDDHALLIDGLMRDEADAIDESIEERLETARRARVPLVISHRKSSGSATSAAHARPWRRWSGHARPRR